VLVARPRASYDASVQLTIYSDYALRTLMYLGSHDDRLISVGEIATAYQVSAHHVAKVAKALARGGFVRAHRGRAGGLELARAPRQLSVGAVVRYTEPTLNLLECFDRATSTCPLTGACLLERTLHEARGAFLQVLDRTMLADLIAGTPSLTTRLGGRRRTVERRWQGAPIQRRTRER
jgi:Rrf2 family transcriptional regulator, nitric oxide-sensitive transcriptional repressor